jgi:hypothetical protein
MKFHAIHETGPAPKPNRIIKALTDLGFQPQPQDDGARSFSEPVVIFWTKGLDLTTEVDHEALEACTQAGRLVSVLVEKRTLPDTLPKHPVVDLVSWRGSPSNPFFRDLCSYLEAALQQSPPPPPRGPMVRLVKRLCGGLTAGVVTVFVFAFVLNVLGLQNNLCSISFNQPNLSDFCGKYGLGGKPDREQRVDWEGRAPNSCEAVRDFMDKHGPSSALHRQASEVLEKRRIIVEEAWVADKQRTIFSQSITAQPAPNAALAQEAALAQSQRIAEASCRAFAESDFYRFKGFEVQPERWDCMDLSDGQYCGFDGFKVCNLERLERTNKEDCGPVK